MPQRNVKFSLIYCDSSIEITCSICNLTFIEFPWYNQVGNRASGEKWKSDSNLLEVECPKCQRKYKLRFSVEEKSNDDVLIESMKKNRLI